MILAIQFARIEFGSRSNGGNACRKSAYNERSSLNDERTGEVFSFKNKDDCFFHKVLLPDGVNVKFLNTSVLWNMAEQAERRINSQTYIDSVLALPDDPQVSHALRIEMIVSYVEKHFISKGLIAQVDIHEPHHGDHNWHAHVLLTTRRLTQDGQEFGEKARDLFPKVARGIVVQGIDYGELWKDHQNELFAKHGLDLRVDPIGIMPQKHLGPVRMRANTGAALERSRLIEQANEELVQDPDMILNALTRQRSVFSGKELDRFLDKHVPDAERAQIKERVLSAKAFMPLYDKESGKESGLYTTLVAREEEQRILRFASRLHEKGNIQVSERARENVLNKFSLGEEQKAAFLATTSESNGLALIQGRAGTGKSHTLNAIREAYEDSGIQVRGLAPTHAVVSDLEKEGFQASTVHAFLFALKNGRQALDKNSVLIVDEAAMLGNSALLELLKAVHDQRAKVVLVGDDRQLSSIERGGMFLELCERFGAQELSEVRRQEADWQKALSQSLSQGDMRQAVDLLNVHQRIAWAKDEAQAKADLVALWERERHNHEVMVITHKNADVEDINCRIHDVHFHKGELGDIEYEVLGSRGRIQVSLGDTLLFIKTHKELGVINGDRGTLKSVEVENDQVRFVVSLDRGVSDSRVFDSRVLDSGVSFNPEAFHGFSLGYASTVHKAQGKTTQKAFVYHSGISSSALSYVALSRQKQDVFLFVSQEKTKSLSQLAYQMGQTGGPKTSLQFDSAQDKEEKAFLAEWKEMSFMERTKVAFKDISKDYLNRFKDKFHKNEAFYNISDPKPSQQGQKPDSTVHMKASLTVHKDWQELTQVFNRLFKASHQKPLRGESLLQSDHGQAYASHQALTEGASERFADLVLGYRVLNAKDPTSEESRCLGLRAQFEEKRYQEIRREDAYKERDDYKQKYKLREEARRLSAIEGRLYGQELVKAVEQGKTLERNLSFYTEAVREYNQHVTNFKETAQVTQTMMGCSSSAAHQTTLMRVQFEERFGVEPPIPEYMKFAKIAEIQKKTRQDLIEKTKEIGANTSVTQEVAVRSLLSAEREELKRMRIDQVNAYQEEPSLREALRSELVVHLRQEDMATIHRDQERQTEQKQEKSLEKSQELELER